MDPGALTRLGARGLVRPSDNALQVVIGPMADQLAGELRGALSATLTTAHVAKGGGGAANAGGVAHAGAVADGARTANTGGAADSGGVADAVEATALLAALGGRANVHAVEMASSRLRLKIGDTALVDQNAIRGLGLRGVAVPGPHSVHVIVGPAAARVCDALRKLLG